MPTLGAKQKVSQKMEKNYFIIKFAFFTTFAKQKVSQQDEQRRERSAKVSQKYDILTSATFAKLLRNFWRNAYVYKTKDTRTKILYKIIIALVIIKDASQ